MPILKSARKNHQYMPIDSAIKGFRTNSGSVRARGRLSELSPEAIKILKEKLTESENCPHDIIVGSKSTVEVTFRSITLSPTTVSIVGVNTKGLLFDKLGRM